MKIVYIDPMSYNNLSKYDKELISNLGNEVVFLCNEKIEYDNIKNAKIIKVFKYSEKKGLLKIFSYIFSVIRISFYTLKIKPDIIHYQWLKLPYFDLFFMKVLKKTTNTKVIFTAHNILPHDTGDKFIKIYTKIYTLIDSIIVHTHRTKVELVTEFNLDSNKIVVIPHGLLDYDLIHTNDKTHGKTNKISLAFIGHLHQYKGIDLLIDAWKEYCTNCHDGKLHLTIAGKGNVDFKGIDSYNCTTVINRFLEENELQCIIDKSDIIIMPYRKISQSGVLLTVLSHRKAIIVTDVGGLTEPFMFGNIGWIMKNPTIESLIEVFQEVANSKEILIEISNDINMWNEIDRYYSWESIGKKTKALYSEITN